MKVGAKARLQALKDLIATAIDDLNAGREADAAAKLITVQNTIGDAVKFVQLFSEEKAAWRPD